MKKSWKSFMTVTAAAAAMTAAMAFSSLAAVAKVDDDLPENRHIVSVASGGYETGFQIKAAHGADIYERQVIRSIKRQTARMRSEP